MCIDGASTAALLIPALQAAKVKVVTVLSRDAGRECVGFIDDVEAHRLAHTGQPLLDAAVVGARKRPIGDAGLWAWDRRDGSVFASPLVAVTLAGTARPRRGGQGMRVSCDKAAASRSFPGRGFGGRGERVESF